MNQVKKKKAKQNLGKRSFQFDHGKNQSPNNRIPRTTNRRRKAKAPGSVRRRRLYRLHRTGVQYQAR